MQYLKVIFTRTPTAFSNVTQKVTRFPYSHVAAVEPDGNTVIESIVECGVVRTTMKKFLERYKPEDILIAYVPCVDLEYAYDFMNKQIGKPYDWAAAYGHLLNKPWHDESAWICSEMIAASSQFFRLDALHSVTPATLYKISKDKP